MANYTEKDYNPATHGYWKGTIDGASNFGYPPNYFYADTLRSIMLGFGNFFNDLKIIRYNNFGEPVKVVDVPLKYGPRQKSHDFRVEAENGSQSYISLPNMTYKIDSLSFDSNRASGIYEQRAFYNDELTIAGIDGEQYWSDVQPTPYNITITLSINCEKMSDINQITEQVLPRFAPAAFFNIKEFWWFNKRRSIKMKLNSPGIQIDSDAMGEEDRRIITGTMTFEVEAWFYKPIKSAPLIKCINLYLSTKNDNIVWHHSTFGNLNGSLTSPYDFSKIYNTGVMNALKLKEGYPITEHNLDYTKHITTYEYEKSEDLVAYDKDTKFLKKVTATLITSADRRSEEISAYDPDTNAIGTYTMYHPISAGEPIFNYNYNMGMYVKSPDTYSGIPIFSKTKNENGTYDIIGYEPIGTEMYVEKEYIYPASGMNPLNDQSAIFGNKVVYDKNGNPYSGYYSQFSEEGRFTNNIDEWNTPHKTVDYYYSAWNGDIHFSGSRYSEFDT